MDERKLKRKNIHNGYSIKYSVFKLQEFELQIG